MNNIEALKLALDGVKVRKVCWDEGEYCVVQDRELVNEDGEVLQHDQIDLKFQGISKLTAFLREHEDFYEEMKARIST